MPPEAGEQIPAECPGGPSRDSDHDRKRGEESSRTPLPEATEGDAARQVLFAQQQARDEEAADHEEYVDPDESAGPGAGHEVEDDDSDDSDRAEPVEATEGWRGDDRVDAAWHLIEGGAFENGGAHRHIEHSPSRSRHPPPVLPA